MVERNDGPVRTPDWRATVLGSSARFEALPPPAAAGAKAYSWQPRVCAGIGLGVPLSRLDSLVWTGRELLSRPGHPPRPAAPSGIWSPPALDLTEGVAYLRGPVLLPGHEDGAGYRLADSFDIAFPDLRSFVWQLHTALERRTPAWFGRL